MKLAVAGLVPSDLREITAGRLAEIRRMGFAGASWHVGDAGALDEGSCTRVRVAFEEAGLVLAQVLPPQHPSLVHPDPTQRAAGVQLMAQCCRLTQWLGGGNLYVRPGSVNPKGPWTPHPENRKPETLRWLVESLQALCEVAVDAEVMLAIEGHVVSPLWDVDTTRLVLDEVASPVLKWNADPVNYVPTLDVAYENTALLDEMFARLEPYVATAHVKDVTVEERLVSHISEVPPGEGYLDYPTFLHRFEEVCPDGYFLIEHLPAEKIPAAREAVVRMAEQCGFALTDGSVLRRQEAGNAS